MAKRSTKIQRVAKKRVQKQAKPASAARRAPAPAAPEEQLVALLKGIYKRWSETKGGNVDEIINLLADDAVWRSIANGLHGLNFAKEPLTKPNVRGYFESLGRDWELVFFDVERMIAQNHTVVVVAECSFRHRRTGKSFMSPKVDIWDFRRGKAVGFFEFFDTASAIRSAL